MNKIILKGRVADDLSVNNYSQNGCFINFTLAVRRRHKTNGEADTDFIRCKAWNNTARFVEKYFNKGDCMIVAGELRNEKYIDSSGENKYITLVNVDEVDFAEKKLAE